MTLRAIHGLEDVGEALGMAREAVRAAGLDAIAI
jgi:hypothetical protein